MTDIIVKYKEGDTRRRLEARGWKHQVFFNMLPYLGRPVFEYKENRVYHQEGDQIIGYSIVQGRIIADKGQVRVNRPVDSFRWVEPIPFQSGLKLYREWAKADVPSEAVKIIDGPA